MYKVPRSDQKLPPPQGWKWRVIGWFMLFGALSGGIYMILMAYPSILPKEFSFKNIIGRIFGFFTFGSILGAVAGLIAGLAGGSFTDWLLNRTYSRRFIYTWLNIIFIPIAIIPTAIMTALYRIPMTMSVGDEADGAITNPSLPPLFWSSVVLAAISAVIIAWLMLRWLERANMKTDEVDSQVALN